MDNFYLTLPSTASTGNTQSSFVTHLAQPINLTGEWEVGLAESHVYHAWNNIDNTNNTFGIEYEGEIEAVVKVEQLVHLKPGLYTMKEIAETLSSSIPKSLQGEVRIQFFELSGHIKVTAGREWDVSLVGEISNLFKITPDLIMYLTPTGSKLTQPYYLGTSSYIRFLHKSKTIKKKEPIRISENLRIPVGWYGTPGQLFDAIKSALPKSQSNHLKITLNANETITMETSNGLKVKFQDGMKDMLGFPTNKMLSGKVTSKYPLELSRGVYGIYVYTDIIVPQLVGNSYAPLLRILPVGDDSSSRSNQKLIVQIYDSPDYLPLLRNSFESIEIYLRTESGDPIVFRSGKTLMKLHFRRAKK